MEDFRKGNEFGQPSLPDIQNLSTNLCISQNFIRNFPGIFHMSDYISM